MLTEYKKYLKDKAMEKAKEVAGAFKIKDEEKIEKMQQNKYKENVKILNFLLQNGIMIEENKVVKINAISKIDGKFYFVTKKGLYDCDSVLTRKFF